MLIRIYYSSVFNTYSYALMGYKGTEVYNENYYAHLNQWLYTRLPRFSTSSSSFFCCFVLVICLYI